MLVLAALGIALLTGGGGAAPVDGSTDVSRRLKLPADLARWIVQAKESSRVSVVPSPGRPRRLALRLQVDPGDTEVAGSGSDGERADVYVGTSVTDGYEGREQWWAWSTFFPSDYNPTPSAAWNLFLDFHNSGDKGQANIGFQVDTHFDPPKIQMTVYGGSLDARERRFTIGKLEREVWYDFVLHVRWSPSRRHGFVELYVNGERVVRRRALATLYPEQNVYLKVANYRLASSQPSAIITEGVRRGESYADVVRGFPDASRW